MTPLSLIVWLLIECVASVDGLSLRRDARVHLVGGGLSLRHLTLEAADVLSNADVVLYDDLGITETEVRALVPPSCELVYVGKRGGQGGEGGMVQQRSIEAQLCAHAATGRRVVRLKVTYSRCGPMIGGLRH